LDLSKNNTTMMITILAKELEGLRKLVDALE
jgi:hypothetical protein